MAWRESVPLVRCRLVPSPAGDAHAQRYVPMAEFGLWKYLMETRHRKKVVVEAVSLWVAEEPGLWDSGLSGDELEPVLRIRFSVQDSAGVAQPVERFFHALSYPVAQEALFRHYPIAGTPADLRATAGYFLPLAVPRPTVSWTA
jgi:hypothetical protein